MSLIPGQPIEKELSERIERWSQQEVDRAIRQKDRNAEFIPEKEDEYYHISYKRLAYYLKKTVKNMITTGFACQLKELHQLSSEGKIPIHGCDNIGGCKEMINMGPDMWVYGYISDGYAPQIVWLSKAAYFTKKQAEDELCSEACRKAYSGEEYRIQVEMYETKYGITDEVKKKKIKELSTKLKLHREYTDETMDQVYAKLIERWYDIRQTRRVTAQIRREERNEKRRTKV